MTSLFARRIAGFFIALIPGLSFAGLPSLNEHHWQGVTISPSFLSVGSGVPVSKCHILTNEHVIRDNQAPDIRFRGDSYESRLIAKDDQNDLALLQVSACPFDRFAVVADRAPQLGDELISTYYSPGFNLTDSMSRTSGRFMGYKKILIKNTFVMDSMVIDDRKPRVGSSGGGVSSDRGLVSVIFAVANRFSEPKTYAVNYQALKRFLDNNLI